MKPQQFCDVPAPAGHRWARIAGRITLMWGDSSPPLSAESDAAERLINAAPEDRSDDDRLTLGLCADRPEGCPPGESRHRWVYDPHGDGSGWALQSEYGATLCCLRGIMRGDLYDDHAVALVRRYHGHPAPKPVAPPLPEGWTVERLGHRVALIAPSRQRVAGIDSSGKMYLWATEYHAPADLIAALAHLVAVAEVPRG